MDVSIITNEGNLIENGSIRGGSRFDIIQHGYNVYEYKQIYHLIHENKIIYTGGKKDTIREMYRKIFDCRGGNTGRRFEDVYGYDDNS